MTLLYNNQEINTQEPLVGFEKTFQKIYRFKVLIPIFPKRSEDWEKFWYKESFTMVLGFSVFFYLMCLFFIYLAIADREHILDLLPLALGWLIVGLVIPAGIYRLIAFILKRQHLVD